MIINTPLSNKALTMHTLGFFFKALGVIVGVLVVITIMYEYRDMKKNGMF